MATHAAVYLPGSRPAAPTPARRRAQPPMSNDPPPAPDQQRAVVLLVAGCFFMEMLDGTIVTTSAPRIARALAVPVGSIALVITAYLVTLAVLIPLSSWIAARIGARSTFLAAIVLFTLASAGCALSASFAELVAMRVLQGAGAAMMVPVGRLMVLAPAKSSELLALTALLVWPGLIAPVLAPLAGGLITTYANWHWLFAINLPLGLLALAVGVRIVHPPSLPPAGGLDVAGLLLVGTGLGAITFTADLLAQQRIDWPLVAAIGLPSALLLAGAVVHLRKAAEPLVNLRLARIRTFRAALAGTAFHFTALSAAPFLAPLLFEEVFHWSPVHAGSVVLLIFVGNVGAKAVANGLYGRYGFRPVLVASTAALAVSLVLLALTGPATPLVLLAAVLLLSGAGRSVGATGYAAVIFADVPQAEMRHANTLSLTTQQLGGSWGVALAAIALRLGDPIGRLFGGTADARTAYAVALTLIACVALLSTVQALRLHPAAGQALRG